MKVRVLGFLLAALAQVWAGEPTQDLKGLTLEELMHVDVTSVRKKGQRLDHSAAAIYVISHDQIRRSGLTSIPELLRLAPGVHVGRTNGSTWAISVRGFNGAYSNKLLVMIDGRTVYNSLFSGVFWDAQDTVIEDIDRIEVVRGPVSPLWGGNAVNGAINIITRGAEQTQGTLLSLGTGSEDRGREAVRYGGSRGENTFYRVYGQSSARPQWAPSGSGLDGTTWGSVQGGFRVDHRISTGEELTVQGDTYRELGDLFSESVVRGPPYLAVSRMPLGASGSNLLARWTLRHADGSQTVIQTYYDRLIRANSRDVGIGIQTADVDIQHWLPVKAKQEWMVGGGYRQMWDRSSGSEFSRLTPNARNYGTAYLSLVDQIELVPDRLAVTLGVRGERSTLSGYNFQPTARIWWAPVKQQSLWGAWSRAVRTPSRGELGFESGISVIPLQPMPALVVAYGSPGLQPETANALDAGYRMEFKRFSIDVTGFHYQYQKLRTFGLSLPQLVSGAQPLLLVAAYAGNQNVGRSEGGEVSALLELTNRSRLTASYSLLSTEVHNNSASGSSLGLLVGAVTSPRHQWQAAWQADLPHRVQFDFWAAYVGSATSTAVGQNIVPAYTRLDVRLSRKIFERGELQVGAQNLLDARHMEFLAELRTPVSEIRRAFYVRGTWRF